MSKDEHAPIHATHRLDIACYVSVETDEQAHEIARYVQILLNKVPEIIRADMTAKDETPYAGSHMADLNGDSRI